MDDKDPLLQGSHGRDSLSVNYRTSRGQPPPVTDSRPDEEREGKLPNEGELTVSKSRWFILAVFSSLCCLQAGTWNTWGAIADTAKVVLNWTDADIALLSNWGPITYILTGFMFSYLLLLKGLRYSVLLSSLIFLLGVSIRCLPVGIEHVKWTMNAGHICIGLAGPVMMGAPTEVSAVWFPPHERTTSTAIASTSPFIGMALSFVVGPLVVSSIPEDAINSTVAPIDPAPYFKQIMNLLYIECGATAVVVVAAMLYFPEKPPTAPSVTATKFRESFKDGFRSMIRSANFWLLAAAYSISCGVFGGWSTQMDTIFQNTLGVGQDTVGWIGFCSNIVVIIGALAVARIVDLAGVRMKIVLILLMVGFCLSGLWCVLLSMKLISFNLASLYISCIAIGAFANAAVPIYFEITVEGLYPVSEGNITMVMTYLNNAFALIFLIMPLFPQIDVVWMNWLLLGSGVVCLPLVLFYKEHYNRMHEDLANGVQ